MRNGPHLRFFFAKLWTLSKFLNDILYQNVLYYSVEKCECNAGYTGFSCEDCDLGYYQSQEDQLGIICEPCNCNGHADICHPLTGECNTMEPKPWIFGPGATVPEWVRTNDTDKICHFFPEYCDVKNETEHCQHNTTGLHCEKCVEGFFGDPTQGGEDVCQTCPCPLAENK